MNYFCKKCQKSTPHKSEAQGLWEYLVCLICGNCNGSYKVK